MSLEEDMWGTAIVRGRLEVCDHCGEHRPVLWKCRRVGMLMGRPYAYFCTDECRDAAAILDDL